MCILSILCLSGPFVTPGCPPRIGSALGHPVSSPDIANEAPLLRSSAVPRAQDLAQGVENLRVLCRGRGRFDPGADTRAALPGGTGPSPRFGASQGNGKGRDRAGSASVKGAFAVATGPGLIDTGRPVHGAWYERVRPD